jgi:hypothetical protein
MVWHYTPGQAPAPIGAKIQDELFRSALDPSAVFTGYSPTTFEYLVCIPQANTNTVIAWCYNFRNQQWTQPQFQGITSLDALDLGPPTLTIGELPGTIAQLTGTIGTLGRSGTPAPAMIYGREDGELLTESSTATTDPVYPTDGTLEAVVPRIISKVFTIPRNDIYVTELRLRLIPQSDGGITFRASVDDGASFKARQKTLDFDSAVLGIPKMMKWTYTVSAERYMFDILCAGKFQFLGYEVHVNRGGDSKGYGNTP